MTAYTNTIDKAFSSWNLVPRFASQIGVRWASSGRQLVAIFTALAVSQFSQSAHINTDSVIQ
jgi:hypothetical protein